MFKDISYPELAKKRGPFDRWRGTILSNFGRGHREVYFCEIILNLDQWFRSRCRLKDFLSGAWLSSCLAKPNHKGNFASRH